MLGNTKVTKWTRPLAIAVVAGIFGKLFWGIDDWSRDWTQNYAALRHDAKKPCLRPITINLPPADVALALTQWVKSQSHWDLATDAPEETPKALALEPSDEIRLEPKRTLHFTRRTRIMRFVDDIHVELRSLADGRTEVHAESQSRVGKGDLGQNPRNLCELTSFLQTL